MTLDEVSKAIADDIRDFLSTLAANRKSNTSANGQDRENLIGLFQDIQPEVSYRADSVLIHILYDNYLSFNGRKISLNGEKLPPIDKLRDWAINHNLPTDNNTLLLIAQVLGQDGSQSKPLFAIIEDEMDKRMEGEWSDIIQNAVSEEINKIFD